ncbi:MAG: phosphoadenosine phosphosulfate reductase family protein [Paracoccaceae bacterium]
MKKVRHILGLSGGRDSAALAIYMRQQRSELDIEYFFTDTGKELPEVYDFLDRLEGFLGKPINKLNPDRDFDFWLAEYGHFLPSARTRWCTRQLKLRPLELWLRPDLDAGVEVHSYVAIRADESQRQGYQPPHPGMHVHFPLMDAGIDKAGVIELLNDGDIGEPEYYRWRSRSGCTFCFFQQKIEWVRLMREHPEAFEEAKRYEKTAEEHGSPFSWSEGETLEQLVQPKRIEAIELDYERRLERLKKKARINPLSARTEPSIDDVFGISESNSCLICHK